MEISTSCCKFNTTIYRPHVYYTTNIKDGFSSASSSRLFYIKHLICLKVKEEKVFRKRKYPSSN